MILCLMYDIENDKVRNKTAKLCKKAGMYRMQYSVFWGDVSPGHRLILEKKLRKLVSPKDKVCLLEISEFTFEQIVYLGQPFDKSLILVKEHALFF